MCKKRKNYQRKVKSDFPDGSGIRGIYKKSHPKMGSFII